MFRSLILLIFSACILIVIPETLAEEGSTGSEYTCSNDVDKLLEEGNAAFTGRFLYEAVKSSPDKNQIMSPFSVLTPLGELALYSDGETKDQLLKLLNLPNKCDIPCVFPKLISNLRAQENVILNVASKIYSTDEYPLSQNFIEDTKDIFDAEAGSLDLKNPEGSAAEINKWVEDQTNDRIKNIASPAMITPDTRLMLVNAIFFKGNWSKQFDKKNTLDRTFYINSEKNVKIPTMYQQNTFRYGESADLDSKVLEIPYIGGNFSLFVLLPNKIDGLLNLVEKLQDQNNFYKAYDEARYEKVNVYLPKSKIESEFNLKDILRKVGIVDLFDPSKSNLTGILEEYEPLYVSAAKQKAFCEMNEEGTEAAAANVFVLGARSASIRNPAPVKIFKADHPFTFHLMNKRNIIFSGSFVTN